MAVMTGLLGADRRVRVLMTCAAALLSANAIVVASRLTSGVDEDPASVLVEEDTAGTVLIFGADGRTIVVDPSSPEGKAAIAAAEQRGDTIVRDPTGAGDPDAIAASNADAPSGATRSAVDLDAADGVVDGIIEVVDAATGKVVQRTVAQVEGAIDRATATTTTTLTAGGDGPLLSITTPEVTVTTPGVTVSTPPVSVTTPPVTVTTPGVSVTTPPVSVGTPVTTVTVPTTTVTVPTTTVTVPTTTVTVPTTTVTVATTTVTVPTTTVTVTTTTLLGL